MFWRAALTAARRALKIKILHALRALGSEAMPVKVRTTDGRDFRFVSCFKHDCWAATGLYEASASAQLAVLKINRVQPLFGIPLGGIGRLLTRREVKAYHQCAQLAGVPACLGTLADDRGFLHAYIPGRHLRPDDRPSETFFVALEHLLTQVHALDMAFVDLNKPQNIILGEDQKPYLTDFQIHLQTRSSWLRWLLRLLQQGDRYHLAKHKYRLRPDLCTAEEKRLVTQRPWYIRLHRRLFRPYFKLRRFILYGVLQASRSE